MRLLVIIASTKEGLGAAASIAGATVIASSIKSFEDLGTLDSDKLSAEHTDVGVAGWACFARRN